MNFTVTTVAQSLAAYLADVLPGVTMYEDPNQQDSKMPCMFLQTRKDKLERETGTDWFLRTLSLDLTYLEDYNLPDLQRRYQRAGEALDLVMETFPYTDGTDTALVRTYERECRIDLDAMHYQFELRERVLIPREYAKMNKMLYDEDITNGN